MSGGSTAGGRRVGASRLVAVLCEEVRNFQPRYLAARALTAALPPLTACRLRTAIWRALGWRIGSQALLFGTVKLSGSGPIHERLTVGEGVWINEGCRIDLNADVVIASNSSLGHEVLVLTSTHQVGRRHRRAGKMHYDAVVIEEGAWIGARSVLFPGVRIGRGAVVSAGSVVNRDVPPNSVVAGSPAVVTVERLPG